jgi:hypothetical protein
MPLEDFIIYVYCCVDDAIHQLFPSPLRTRGFAPKLSDAELVTMEIVGEFMGKDCDKTIWRYFRNHWHPWFPNLGSRANFVKQSANLWIVKEEIQQYLARKMGALADSVHMSDGFPMPVCTITRASRNRCFPGEAAYGYCASKDEYYYGFEGHLVVSFDGIICGYTFAAANIDERDVLQDMTDDLRELLISDKGLIRPELKAELAKQGLNLQTPLRKNMKDSRPKEVVRLFMKIRRRVETVISQLSEQFHIEKVRAKDLWHLSNRFIRKILAHTVGIFLNKLLGHPPLHLAELVEI